MYSARLLEWTDVHYSHSSSYWFNACSVLPLALAPAPAPAAAPPIRGLSCDAMFPDVEQEGGWGGEKKVLISLAGGNNNYSPPTCLWYKVEAQLSVHRIQFRFFCCTTAKRFL